MASYPLDLPTSDSPSINIVRDGPLFILTMLKKDNVFTPEFCQAFIDGLDAISATVKSEKLKEAALITTGAGKFYSNGLSFEEVVKDNTFPIRLYLPLLNKILLFDIPTVACIQGHAFAGGCLVAMAHDYRVMRSDRGVICMSEIDMPWQLPGGLSALLRAKLPHHVYRTAVMEAKRYGGQEALDNHMVDFIGEGAEGVMETAKQVALKLAPKTKAGKYVAMIKQEMYPEVTRLLLHGTYKM